jgi:hypothetical protein
MSGSVDECKEVGVDQNVLFVTRDRNHCRWGGIEMARFDAFIANHLEQIIEIKLSKTKDVVVDTTKLAELIDADEHTLVSYFRKPCSCLDQKYAEVKSIKNLGWCNNTTCSRPDGMVERSTMLSCTRCRQAYYCSQECQAQDWRFHKKL